MVLVCETRLKQMFWDCVLVCFLFAMPGVRDMRSNRWRLTVGPTQARRAKAALQKRVDVCSRSKKGCSLQAVEATEAGIFKIEWKKIASYNSVASWISLAMPSGFTAWTLKAALSSINGLCGCSCLVEHQWFRCLFLLACILASEPVV
jgi:hypothetical protein